MKDKHETRSEIWTRTEGGGL